MEQGGRQRCRSSWAFGCSVENERKELIWAKRDEVGSRFCEKRACRVVSMRVSRLVMSAWDCGVNPARVMAWRQIAIVRASGLLVKTEQLLQQSSGPRQYFVMQPDTRPMVSLHLQTMHLSCVGFRAAWMVVMGLWRWRVAQGAHQLLLACIVQVWPRMSKDPQWKQDGGGGVGMWLCFFSVSVRHGAHS